jgi:hypothetical protein
MIMPHDVPLPQHRPCAIAITAVKPAASGPFKHEMTTNDDIFAPEFALNDDKSMAYGVLGVVK